MSKKQQDSENFMGQFFDLQRQYLDNLNQLFHFEQPDIDEAENPFDNWWHQFGTSDQPGFNEYFKQMSKMGMDMMQNPFEYLQQPASQTQNLSNWFSAMNQQFEEWIKAGSKTSNPVVEQMNRLFRQQMQAPFGLPFSQGWQNPFIAGSSVGSLNSQFLQLLQNLYSDQDKAQGESLLKSLEQYQNTMLEFNYLMASVAMESLTRLQQKMNDSENASIDEMYQWWMTASKEVFDQQQLEQSFQGLKSKIEKLQENLIRDFQDYRLMLTKNLGLVTREEYNGLLVRMDQLNEEIKQLKNEKVNKKESKPGKQTEDDFSVLSGIGAKFNEKLHQQGIHNLQQLASLSDEMLNNLDQELQTKGKIFQEQWREQAEHLLNSMTGKGK